jgi:hypothetical protein
MTTETLTAKLEQLGSEVDYSDPNTYTELLYGQGEGDQTATEQPQGETVQTETAPAEQPAEEVKTESSETPAAAEAEPEVKVDGVLTRDGKHVIPFEVLDQARKTAQTEAQRRAELEKSNQALLAQIEALQKGAQTAADTPTTKGFTKDRIEAAREDFPEMAALMEGQNELLAKLEAAQKAAAPVVQQPAQANEAETTIQNLIDARPLLARWQASGGVLWSEAIRVDDQLKNDPAWASKSVSERFEEAERRVAAQIGVEIPTQKKAEPPAVQPQKTQVSVKPAPNPSLTDFNGASPVQGENPLANLPVGKAVDKAMSMDLADIYRSVGLSM